MKKTLKLAVIGALMAMGVTQTHAAVAKTIWAAHLSFTLTVWEDGVSKAAKITTKDIVKDLSGAVSAGVTNPVFSTGSQLLLKEDTTTSNSVLVVRDTKTKVDTDVSAFFNVNGSDSVSFTPPNGKTTTKHSITTFSFEAVTISFSLTGFTTETKALENGDQVTTKAAADVSGTGTVGTTSGDVIHGTVALGGSRLEAPL